MLSSAKETEAEVCVLTSSLPPRTNSVHFEATKPSLHSISLLMFRQQSKYTRHVKKQENRTQNQVKIVKSNSNQDKTLHVLKQADKSLKMAITTVFKDLGKYAYQA
jgi:fatty acid/phospholipid biosynthesis enzyme